MYVTVSSRVTFKISVTMLDVQDFAHYVTRSDFSWDRNPFIYMMVLHVKCHLYFFNIAAL